MTAKVNLNRKDTISTNTNKLKLLADDNQYVTNISFSLVSKSGNNWKPADFCISFTLLKTFLCLHEKSPLWNLLYKYLSSFLHLRHHISLGNVTTSCNLFNRVSLFIRGWTVGSQPGPISHPAPSLWFFEQWFWRNHVDFQQVLISSLYSFMYKHFVIYSVYKAIRLSPK